MADPQPNPNPQVPPLSNQQGSSTSGLGSIDVTLANLRRAFKSTEEGAKSLGQAQAILVDRYKQQILAISGLQARIMESEAALKGLEKLSKKRSGLSKREKLDIQLKIAARKAELDALNKYNVDLQGAASELEKTLMGLAKKQEAIARLQRMRAIRDERLENLLPLIKTKQAAARLAQEKGILGTAGSYMGRRLIKDKALAGGSLVKGFGYAYIALQGIAEILNRATKNSTDFVNAFGASGKLYADAAFRMRLMQGVNMAFIKSADMAAFASKTLAGGVFGLYQQQQMGITSARDMADYIGKLGSDMILAGKALGLNAEQSSKLFVDLTQNMGVFAGTASNVDAYSKRLDDTFRKLSAAQRLTGFDTLRLTGMLSEFSAVTLPLGRSFDEVTAQVVGAISAIKELSKSLGANTAEYFKTAGNMESFTKTLFSMGKAITPAQAVGYQMVAAGGTGGDVFKNIMAAVSMTPMQRLAGQVTALQKVFGPGGRDVVGTALLAQGYSDQVVAIIRKMMDKPGQFKGLISAMSTAGPLAQQRLEQLSTDTGVAELRNIGRILALREDPMETVIRLLEQLLDLASSFVVGLPAMLGKGPVGMSAAFMNKRMSKVPESSVSIDGM